MSLQMFVFNIFPSAFNYWHAFWDVSPMITACFWGMSVSVLILLVYSCTVLLAFCRLVALTDDWGQEQHILCCLVGRDVVKPYGGSYFISPHSHWSSSSCASFHFHIVSSCSWKYRVHPRDMAKPFHSLSLNKFHNKQCSLWCRHFWCNIF